MKKFLFLMLCIIFPLFSFAETENVGIVKGIWFSEAPFFEGENIRIYTAIQNNSGSDVEGELEFYDNDVYLGKKSFSALHNRVIESWIDTTAESGDHEFSVKITQLDKSSTGEDVVPITAESIISERLVVVKSDTDGDDIPNDIDDDDDNDGFSDIEEFKNGTDPLDKNDIPEDVEQEKEDTENIVDTLINKILNITEKTPDGVDNQIQELIDDDTLEREFIEQTPVVVQDLANDNNFVETVALHISKVQNIGQNLVKNEQERILKIDISESKKETQTDSGNISTTEDTQSKLQGFLFFLYTWILNLFGWLFSMWWFVVIFLFLGIYIVLRILFKIFGKRD